MRTIRPHARGVIVPNMNSMAYLGPVFNSLYSYDGRKLPSDYELLREYASNDIVYACVNINAAAVAQVPLRLYSAGKSAGKAMRSHGARRVERITKARLRRNKNLVKMIGPGDEVVEIAEHPILDLLYDDSDGLDGLQKFLLTQTYQEIMGRAYWHTENAGITGSPTSLYLLKPQRLLPVRDDNGGVTGYKYQPDLRGQWDDYPTEEIIDFRFPHPEDPYGWGHCPLKSAYLQSILTSKFTQYGNDLMDNRARVDGVFIPKEDLGADMARKAEDQFQQRFAQRRNGGVWFSPTAGQFVPTKYSPTDLGPMEIDKNTVSRLARAFGVPEPLLSANEATFSNMAQALQFHAKFTISPRVLMMEQRLNTLLVPMFDDGLFLAADNPIPEDNEFELKKTQVAIDARALTKNEIREVAGYEPMEGEGVDELPQDEQAQPDPAQPNPEPEPEEPADKPREEVKKAFDTGRIIEINKAVASGEMPRAVAITLIAKAFEIGEEEARGLVGFPPRGEPAQPTAIEKSEGPHKYASTQVGLPPEIAQPMLALANAIPRDELAEDGIENDPHVTLKYGIHSDDPTAVINLLKTQRPVTLTFGDLTLFDATDEHPFDVLKLDVQSDDLQRLFAMLKDGVPNVQTYPEYQPHATIAYLKPGMGKKYTGKHDVSGKSLTVAHIQFSSRDGSKTTIPLRAMCDECGEQDCICGEVAKAIRKALPGVPPGNHADLATGMKAYFADQKAEALAYSGNVPDVERTKRDKALSLLLLGLMLPWSKESGSEALETIHAPRFAGSAFGEAIEPAAGKAANFYAQKINQTTYNRLAAAIEAGTREGKVGEDASATTAVSDEPATSDAPSPTPDPTTAAVDEIFDDAIERRAPGIAEDIAYKAKMIGQYLAAKYSGIVVKKIWISYEGACPLCDALNGQVKEMGESFDTHNVGDAGAVGMGDMFPGEVHPFCRCRLGVILDTGELIVL